MANTDQITEAQKRFIDDLVKARDLTALNQDQIDFLMHPIRWSAMNRKQASDCIKLLLEQPKKQETSKPTPQIQATDTTVAVDTPVGLVETTPPDPGYYFIVDPTDNKEKFYRVQKGKPDTQWANHSFLSVQASDYWYPVKDKSHRDTIYAEINRDPVNAMNQYGIKLGRCGVCNRTLTDRDSRLRGIGPICAANLGPSEDELDLLNQLGLG